MSATTLPSKRRFTPERLGALIGATAASVVAIVAIGRFVGNDDRPASIAVATAPTTLAGSITSFEARTRTDPADARSWTTLGELYVRQAAATGDPAFYGLATTALERADALTPDDPATLTARGGLALAVHDFADARDLASQAIAAAPFRAEPYAVATDAAVELGDYDTAEAMLQTLLELRPDSAALTRTSYLRELHGDMTGALNAMRAAEQAAAAEPAERAVIASYLGDLELANGSTDAAAAAYGRALDAAPGLLGAELGLARVAVANGRDAEAADLLDDLVARSPQPAVAALLTEVRLRLGDERGATDAAAIVSANDRLLRSAGVVVDLEAALFEADHGDPATAVELATAAHAARQTVFTADAMAWALVRSGRAAEAVPHAEAAIRLGTPTASLRVHAAAAFDAAGRPDEARTELEAAFRQAPWFALSARPVAVELAERLGVDVPTTWRS